MWGVLLVPSSSPTLSPIYDGIDVNVTYNVTWFHLNHDMVSRRIYKLSFYGGHSIACSYQRRLSSVFSVVSLLCRGTWLLSSWWKEMGLRPPLLILKRHSRGTLWYNPLQRSIAVSAAVAPVATH